MKPNGNIRRDNDGINYLDYSDFMGVPCGIIIRNSAIEDVIPNDNTIIHINQYINGGIGHNPIVIKLNQKHTYNIIKPKDNLTNPADGVFTDDKKYLLTIRTADCFPVLLSDGNIVGAIHAGWRGAFLGIIKNYFIAAKNFNRGQCKVVIGPGINQCCFEVSAEVAILFDKKYRHKRNSKFYVDIKGFILDELKCFGVNYIVVNGDCTACNIDKYYSYRREGSKVKEMLSFISTGG